MPWLDKVEIGDCALYLGDCLQVIPCLPPFDAVITDPPYGTDPDAGGYGRAGRAIAGDHNLEVFHAAAELIAQAQSDFWAAFFYSSRRAPEFFSGIRSLEYFGEIVWDKAAPGLGGALRYQHEMVALFLKGLPRALLRTFSVLRSYRVAKVHPHEKPVGLMRRLCEIIPGERILDPFMGSGTTGVACANLGRGFIGVEIERRYFDIACQRIEEAHKQADLFAGTPKASKQESLL